MKSFHTIPGETRKQIKYVLTDIDDTLTLDGKLPAVAYTAMEQLQQAGIKVIPITGRPAGWCDHIARMWPVDGLVGENGAFYFYYDNQGRRMIRRFWRSDEQRRTDQLKLAQIQKEILQNVAGCAVSVDQPYREADLAIDFCEDVPPLPMSEVKKIVSIFEAAGAVAKISSIHVNGWFGEYDKLTMTRRFFAEIFQIDLEKHKNSIVFSGDSPNDAPMFGYFPNSVGVANVLEFGDELENKPAWITQEKGGNGFAEMADILLSR
ncbi:MAG: HAD-IIB family hydrolase [Desulfobulbaceae bacterium]|uniref:HAD-IIB family hydrolase n=1 Tax=Candidatus Desulfatifera sulfidica TaxID=2841691 RepID=A0A8J6TAQ1_9BACT|nr:HAD-IIB family hydrolase [Candidatus Desulfatifera sulfidica]